MTRIEEKPVVKLGRALGGALLVFLVLWLAPSLAQAQCIGGLITGCPLASTPQATDLLWGWQLSTSPQSPRKVQLQQVTNGGFPLTIPNWATAGRPASPNLGQTGFNTTTGAPEFWSGSAWVQGGGGGGSITWPAVGSVVISTGTSSPSGVAPVNGNVVYGSGGVWTSTSLATILASPPAIGGTAPAAGSFTTLSSNGAVTLGGLGSGTAAGCLTYTSGNAVTQTPTGTAPCAGGITWPTSGDLVLSNSTSSPPGLAPVNGECAIGAGGAWTVGSCSGSGTSVTSVAGSGLVVASPTTGSVVVSLSSAAADTLLGNPTGSSAAPTTIGLGAGLSIVSSNLAAQWSAGAVSSLGVGLSISSGVLIPQWAGGAVTGIGSNCSITTGVFNCAGGGSTTFTVAPGLASTVGTQNTGSQTISNGSTLSQQNWAEVITSTPYTVSYPADTGATLLSNAASSPVAYTLRNPSSGTQGSVSPVFGDEGGNGFSLTTVGGTATFYGFVGGGIANPTFSPYSLVQCTDDGANYFCLVSQGYSQLAIGQTAINLGVNGDILFDSAGTLANEAATAISFNSGTISLGGNLTTSAGLTTTGTGSPTFGFPTGSYTYTFPSISANLASLGNVSQTFAGATTFTNSVTFGVINSYLAHVFPSSATSCTLATDNTGCSGQAAGDCGVFMRFTSSSAVTVTEPSTFPTGCEVALEQDGTGKVSVAQGAGAVLRANPHGYTGTYAQYAIIGVVGLAPGTAVVTGDGS